NTRLEIKVEGANGMDYVFLGKTLPFDRISARLLFTNDRLQIIDLRGALLAGTLRGNADISLARNDPRYRANISVSQINFPLLTNLYYNYKTALGLLSGTYDFTGLAAIRAPCGAAEKSKSPTAMSSPYLFSGRSQEF